MATARKQGLDGLAGKLIDHIERACAVRGTGIVAEIHIVIFGKSLTNFFEYGQATVA